ncbi:MAG: PilZ domain-containing protein [Planctomycetota bacterium]
MKFFPSRSDEQAREAYRVRLERSPLRVIVVVADEDARQVELLDLSAGGCALRAQEGDLPGLTVGATVLLRFESRARSLYAQAAVRSHKVVDGWVRVGLQFVERDLLWQQLDEGLWRYFNRRQAYRVSPAREATGPATVNVTVGDVQRVDLLHDLSCTGLSLRISNKDPFVFPTDALVDLRFELAQAGAPFRFGAMLVHDTLVRGSRRVGFRFDPLATPNLQHEQERVLQYVLARQRTLQQLREEPQEAGTTRSLSTP